MIVMNKPGEATLALAKCIEQAIFDKGWSHDEAARRLGVSQPTISRWVRGDWTPHRTRIAGLIQVLGLDPESVRRLYREAKIEQSDGDFEADVEAVDHALEGLVKSSTTIHGDLERRLSDLEARFDQLLSRLALEIDPPTPP